RPDVEPDRGRPEVRPSSPLVGRPPRRVRRRPVVNRQRRSPAWSPSCNLARLDASQADRVMLVLHQHPARLRARALAVAEALSVLADANAAVESGGPLAERSGVAWISVDAHLLPDVEDRIGYLGYVEAVDIVEPAPANDRQAVRWRKRPWHLRRIHAADPDQLRRRAPDQRTFVLGSAEKTRVVRGYRGSSAPLERRGLPVIDARLLANLAARGRPGSRLLDPFAGAGGIVLAGEDAGYATYSADVDAEV